MSGEKLHLADVLRHIDRREDIPHDLMNSAINEITDTSFTKQERSTASQISERAGTHLESWALLRFISGKYTEEEITSIVETRKALVSRLSLIVPSIIEILKLKNINEIASAIHQIYDCAGAFSVIEKSQFSSQQRKKAIQEVNSIIRAAEQLDDILDQASSHVDVEFNQHQDAVARFIEFQQDSRHLEDLRRELNALVFASRLTLYRDTVGERALYVGDNRAKTHVVKCAYELTLSFGTPPLKTTPGSDFSNLCSLIHELATGIPHESLAGAINKFARSPERQEIDKEEEIHRFQNSDEGIAEYEADNFSGVKARIKSLEEEEAFWKNTRLSQFWDDTSSQQISIRLLDVLQQKEMAMKEHGPFIVWASQMSRTTLDEWQQEIEWHENRMLALAIERGQHVRDQ